MFDREVIMASQRLIFFAVFLRALTHSQDFSLLLVDGPDEMHGRVAIMREGVEGSLCYTPDPNILKVICKMMEYDGEDVSSQNYGPGNGTVILKVDRCFGNEASIEDCQHPGWGIGTEDCTLVLGVNCGLPHGVFVYLENGDDRLHGRVSIINWNGIGTVCGNNFTISEARVICNMLGYTKSDISITHYGSGKGIIWLNNLQCVGKESSILDCEFPGWGFPGDGPTCSHGEDVGIECGVIVPDNPTINVPLGFNLFLVDGPDELHGRVVLTHNGVNGSVCNHHFNESEAIVICSMLGYRGPGVAITDSYGIGTGPIWLDDVICQGTEMDIRYCQHRGWGIHNCSHFEDIGINCGPVNFPIDFKLSLIDGPDALHGRVVMYYKSVTGTLCDDDITVKELTVICRMVGYSGADISARFYGAGTGPIHMDELACQGNESSILSCEHGTLGVNDCGHDEDLGVDCGVLPMWYIKDGPDVLHGRLIGCYGAEMCGNICNEKVNISTTRVLCRMFGYTGRDIGIRSYGPGESVVPMTNVPVLCNGDENDIEDCTHNFGDICPQEEHVGINCGPFARGSVFLVDGPDRLHGRVVLNVDGIDGMICGIPAGYSVALVICRMLGYFKTDVSTQGYGRGEVTVWLQDVTCSGTENSIFDCHHQGLGGSSTYICPDAFALGVNCGPVPGLTVKVVGGPDFLHGLVVVTNNGREGTICRDSFDSNDAKVICIMLGYSDSGAAVAPVSKYPTGTGFIWLDDLACGSSHKNLAECLHPGWGIHNCLPAEDVGLDCGPVYEPEDLNGVFLVDGPDALHGRLVLTYNGTNGTVCDDSFTEIAATIVCRMLGYSGTGVQLTSDYGAGEGPIHLDEVRCQGTETYIQHCQHNPWGIHDCNHNEDVSINCGP